MSVTVIHSNQDKLFDNTQYKCDKMQYALQWPKEKISPCKVR
ncbi:hypothetical protein PPEP_a3567 [Pseudoalteromonas peptidolytica F12-50-A1]|uniref:Uncharacterized protein n=1 Tax=Pseudoalteromonas peptidolytica F12-50-A1 TaxID=1315280 RepID=A0A8I0T3G9_9GAMM|nr:hypothetical protein [Pseudoalteromonas peptidolytica F12-50-A1]